MKVDKNELKDLIAEIIETDTSAIGDDSNFVTDLAMNSLQMLDCVAEIEDRYDIRIPKGDINKLTSVDNVIEYMEGL